MPPKIHLVRHAEGEHNLSQTAWTIIDPALTPYGLVQCHQLRENFPHHSQVGLVVSSPLSRAISTAVEGFRPVFENEKVPGRSVELVLLPDLQEIGDFPCDVGSEGDDLRRKVEKLGVCVNFGFVERGWTSKTGRYKPALKAIEQRAKDIRLWLYRQTANEIVVVSHGAFLHFLTDDWEEGYSEKGTGWSNAEYRSYELQPKSNKNKVDGQGTEVEDFEFVETAESRRQRGRTGPVSTQEKQKELYAAALRAWEEQGYLVNAARVNGA